MSNGKAMHDLLARISEIRAREGFDADLFGFNRNGLRMAISSIQDETKELYDLWSENKRFLHLVSDRAGNELLDIAACAMLAYSQVNANNTLQAHEESVCAAHIPDYAKDGRPLVGAGPPCVVCEEPSAVVLPAILPEEDA